MVRANGPSECFLASFNSEIGFDIVALIKKSPHARLICHCMTKPTLAGIGHEVLSPRSRNNVSNGAVQALGCIDPK
jgi:hypothetical protein